MADSSNKIIEQFSHLPLDSGLLPSKTNPRKTFEEGALNELAQSIKSQGVAQPILVRPVEKDGSFSHYEIVAGERRYRASLLAGATDIPAMIRNLTDEQAREIQVVENLQREDLHPMEEAEALKELMLNYSYSAEQLGEKIGQSRSYVYAQLKLCTLQGKARELFLANKLTPSLALLVTRISLPALQEQAAVDLSGVHSWNKQPMSQREAISHIQRNYVLQLKDAPFNLKDAELVPKAGACVACPKRTGNQTGLEDDLGGANVCTDPDCFKGKREQWQIITLKKARDKGLLVIESSKEAKQIFPYSYSEPKGGYHKKSEKCYADSKQRTYGQLAKEVKVDPVVVINPHTSLVTELISDRDLEPFVTELGLKKKDVALVPTVSAADQARQTRQETAYRRQVLTTIFDKAKQKPLSIDDWRMVCARMVDRLDHNDTKRLLEFLGWGELHGWEQRSAFVQKFASLNMDDVQQVMFAAALISETYSAAWSNSQPERLLAAAERHGVDAKAVKQEIKAAAKAEEKKKLDAKKAKEAAKKKPAKAHVAKIKPRQ